MFAGWLLALTFGLQNGQSDGRYSQVAKPLAKRAGVNLSDSTPQAGVSIRSAICAICRCECQIVCREPPEIMRVIEAPVRSATHLQGGICYKCWHEWTQGGVNRTPFVCFQCADRAALPPEHRILKEGEFGSMAEYVYRCPTCETWLRTGPRQPKNYDEIPDCF
jgi:hypothetical protein